MYSTIHFCLCEPRFREKRPICGSKTHSRCRCPSHFRHLTTESRDARGRTCGWPAKSTCNFNIVHNIGLDAVSPPLDLQAKGVWSRQHNSIHGLYVEQNLGAPHQISFEQRSLKLYAFSSLKDVCRNASEPIRVYDGCVPSQPAWASCSGRTDPRHCLLQCSAFLFRFVAAP
jgi:hypothetical protein